MKLHLVHVVALLCLARICSAAAPSWTVMIYMNTDISPDMDCFALEDFAKIANLGSRSGIREVFVELGRPNPTCGERWGGVRSFHVIQGMAPSEKNSNPVHVSAADLGKGSTVAEFVSWAMKCSKTDHYALIMWGHGLGLTFGPSPTSSAINFSGTSLPASRSSGVGTFGSRSAAPRALHVADLAHSLKLVLGSRQLDIIAMDNCLMGTLENAYAFRRVAHFMVASEPVIMTGAWDYYILSEFMEGNPEYASQSMISALEFVIKRFDSTTAFAATDLSRAAHVGTLLSNLSIALQEQLSKPSFVKKMMRIRGSLDTFGQQQQGEDPTVDLGLLVEKLMDSSFLKPKAHKAAVALYEELKPAAGSDGGLFIVKNYTPTQTQNPPPENQNYGISIYFPASYSAWEQWNTTDQSYDPDSCWTVAYPIAFVCHEQWAPFLKALLYRAKSLGIEAPLPSQGRRPRATRGLSFVPNQRIF